MYRFLRDKQSEAISVKLALENWRIATVKTLAFFGYVICWAWNFRKGMKLGVNQPLCSAFCWKSTCVAFAITYYACIVLATTHLWTISKITEWIFVLEDVQAICPRGALSIVM